MAEVVRFEFVTTGGGGMSPASQSGRSAGASAPNGARPAPAGPLGAGALPFGTLPPPGMVFRSPAQTVTPLLNRPQILPALPNGAPAAAGGGGAVGNVAGQAARLAISFSRVSSATGAVTSGIAATGSGLAAVAPVLAGFAVTLGLAVAATTLFVRRIQRQAQELAPFSGNLAASQARTNALTLQQQIRSAQLLGPDLAKFNDAQTKLGLATTRILDAIESAFLPALIPVVEGIASMADGISWLVGNDKKTADDSGNFLNIFLKMEDLSIDDTDAHKQRGGNSGFEQKAPGFGPLLLP